MADLATLTEFKEFLDLSGTGDDTALQGILDRIEELIEEMSGETFVAAGTVTDEAHYGTGTNRVYLHRPASSVTKVKLGRDKANPDDEFTDAVDFQVHDRELERTDGGKFPLSNWRNVWVTYEAEANLPGVVKEMLLEGAAYVFRQRGKEHVSGETVGEFGAVTLRRELMDLPTWKEGMAVLRRPVAV